MHNDYFPCEIQKLFDIILVHLPSIFITISANTEGPTMYLRCAPDGMRFSRARSAVASAGSACWAASRIGHSHRAHHDPIAGTRASPQQTARSLQHARGISLSHFDALPNYRFGWLPSCNCL